MLHEFIDQFYTTKLTTEIVETSVADILEEGFDKGYVFIELMKQYHREKVNRGNRGKIRLAIKLLEPKVYYIYKLYQGDSLIYIGQSQSLWRRLKSHKQDKEFDKVEIYMCQSDEDVDEVENYLILKYQPPLNKKLDLVKAKQYTKAEPTFDKLEEPTSIFAPISFKISNNNCREKYLYIEDSFIGVRNDKGIIPYWVNCSEEKPYNIS